jgi:hypothetical protein
MSISTVTSEALQLKLRQLLPSQQGFGTDLSASDTIIPIVDLTRAAEGSDVPDYLTNALAFSSQTDFTIGNTTSTITATTGFFRIFGTAQVKGDASANRSCLIEANDGSSTKRLFEVFVQSIANPEIVIQQYDFIVFNNAGETIDGTAGAFCDLTGTIRQIADINGTLVNPVGFNPQ